MNTPAKILVADDNVVNQTVVKRLLEHEGYVVEIVSNGAEAIEALENARYHLVVMDCMMPVMDGFEATSIIRGSNPGRLDPGIPIIATTALATAEDCEKCMDAGMTAYVSKPIAASSFLETVASSLNDAGGIEKHANKRGDAPASPSDDEVQRAFQANILSSMSGSIMAEAEQWQQELQAHTAAGSLDDLGKLAHKIRGTADVIGKTRLSAISENLEATASRGNLKASRSLTADLVDALQQLILELR